MKVLTLTDELSGDPIRFDLDALIMVRPVDRDGDLFTCILYLTSTRVDGVKTRPRLVEIRLSRETLLELDEMFYDRTVPIKTRWDGFRDPEYLARLLQIRAVKGDGKAAQS